MESIGALIFILALVAFLSFVLKLFGVAMKIALPILGGVAFFYIIISLMGAQ